MKISEFLSSAGEKNPVHVCELPLSVSAVEALTATVLDEYIEDGLGICFTNVWDLGEGQCLLKGFKEKSSIEPGVVVIFRENQSEPDALLQAVLAHLQLETSELCWVNEQFLGYSNQ